jgi:Flp pilus assembly pilin Flp
MSKFRPLRGRRGASLMTYGLLTGLIAVVALAAVSGMGEGIGGMFGNSADSLEGAANEAGAPGAPVLELTVASGDPQAMDLVGPGDPLEGEPVGFRVENTGARTSSELSVTLESGVNFEILSDDCTGRKLEGGSSCGFEIRSFSSLNGALADRVEVSPHNRPGIDLAGAATNFDPASLVLTALSGDPALMDVVGPGSPAPGTPVSFQVENIGGFSSAPLAVALAAGSNFEILNNSCEGASLAGGAICGFDVRPFASAAGPLADTVTVSGNNSPSQALAGTASAFAPASLTLSALSGNPAAMNVTGPGSPAYGATVNFQVQNTGNFASAALAVGLSSATNFQILNDTCTGVSLAGGGSCGFDVRSFASSAGALSSTLTVTGDNSPSQALSGTASSFAPASLTLSATSGSPSAMNVSGPGSPAYSSPVTFQVTNTGNFASATLTVSLASGVAFQLQNDNCTGVSLTGGANCTFQARSFSSGNGSLSTTVTVQGNNNPNQALSGTASGFPQFPASIYAVGANRLVTTSNDGLTWSSFTLTALASGTNLISGAASPTRILISGSANRYAYSDNGVNWTAGSGYNMSHPYGTAYGNSRFVVAGVLASGSAVGYVVSTNGGASWSGAVTPSFEIFELKYVNNTFVLMGFNRGIRYSGDGINWTDVTVGGSGELWASATYFAGNYYMGGNSSAVYRGSSLSSLSAVTVPNSGSIRCGAASSGAVVFRGQPFAVYSSTGASNTWTSVTTGGCTGMVHNGTRFIGVNSGGSVWTSPDAANWTLGFANTSEDLNDIFIAQ